MVLHVLAGACRYLMRDPQISQRYSKDEGVQHEKQITNDFLFIIPMRSYESICLIGGFNMFQPI